MTTRPIGSKILFVGFDVLTAVTLESYIVWDIGHCTPVKFNLHSEADPVSCLVHAGLLLRLVFDPEDRGNMFLRNMDSLSPYYNALYP
jgi:hypothetical protein